jgi:hypothetical protein
MDLIQDLIQLIISGLEKLTVRNFYLTILSAFMFSIVCALICNYYCRLWNKSYRTTITHKILTGIASSLTFIFVLAFVAFSFFKDISLLKIDFWEDSLSSNKQWSNETFNRAYQKVKAIGSEDFSNNPVEIPTTRAETNEIVANIFSNEACENFNTNHPFISKIIWAEPKISEEIVKNDISSFFSKGGNSYNTVNAVKLVGKNIKEQLIQQAPRIVTTSRIILILLFIIIQLIPFGIIGFSAYKNLKIQA